ncbi:hydrogenase maturation protease [Chroococcidiopsis sp. FACHB-1243]|uniref:hydrogenase maturation protease n=1 Tax=Chroococcidiopsis sp. [FACHB-1243] TaxID=2692781 RepID=UPI00177F7BF8|nr:hydrogenase maturation protease [Chroococcidiopsis sp. [FACHB-1243]]MBD2304513.1 hydrogenase maturation protease [Chroococcidiopsis sp. [FACHB-1243]]
MSNNSKTILLIGYGNDLRSDDAVGQKVANAIASEELPDVTSLCVHQLTPELATFLATADLAIFIDACFASVCEDVRLQAIASTNSTAIGGHTGDPRSLLALTYALYNRVPNAWWVTIPGTNFELGDRLSPIAERGMQTALKQIKQLIQLGKVELCTKLE